MVHDSLLADGTRVQQDKDSIDPGVLYKACHCCGLVHRLPGPALIESTKYVCNEKTKKGT